LKDEEPLRSTGGSGASLHSNGGRGKR